MNERQKFLKNVSELEKEMSKIQGITLLGKKTYEDRNIASIRYNRKDNPNSLLCEKIKENYINKGFNVEFKEGAYWLKKPSENYALSINSLSGILTIAKLKN